MHDTGRNRRKDAIILALVLAVVPVPRLQAQIQALEPEQAGPDFPFQGEYLGESALPGGAKRTVAAQVAAQGNGAFRIIFLPGGFPGAGWGGTGRVEIKGTRSGDRVNLSGGGYAGLIAEGAAGAAAALTGTGPDQASLSLAKVERRSPTLGLGAPLMSTVLFDGKGVSAWKSGATVDARGFLGVPAETVKRFGSYSLHLEFRLPFEPSGRGQGRANSGVAMPTGGWSELQVLDSFGDEPYIDGCGALYNTASPKVTGNLPPLAWQTYDIHYTAPPATGDGRITVWLNGVLVQDKTVMKNRPATSVLQLQYHDHPVFYRNLWMVEGRDDFNFFPASAILLRERSLERSGVRLGAWSAGLPPWDAAISGGASHPGPLFLRGGGVRDLLGRRAVMPAPRRSSAAPLLPEVAADR